MPGQSFGIDEYLGKRYRLSHPLSVRGGNEQEGLERTETI
jgi:hypothetical protein